MVPPLRIDETKALTTWGFDGGEDGAAGGGGRMAFMELDGARMDVRAGAGARGQLFFCIFACALCTLRVCLCILRGFVMQITHIYMHFTYKYAYFGVCVGFIFGMRLFVFVYV